MTLFRLVQHTVNGALLGFSHGSKISGRVSINLGIAGFTNLKIIAAVLYRKQQRNAAVYQDFRAGIRFQKPLQIRGGK